MLIKEYELCQQSVQQKDSSIWQTFSILGVAYSAGLAILPQTKYGPGVAAAIGVLVVASVWIWWSMANRWWDLQHSELQRMRDIEEDVKVLYRVRYVAFRDGYLNVEKSGLDEKRWSYLRENPTFKKRGVKKALRFFPIAVTVVWSFYVLSAIPFNEILSGGLMLMFHSKDLVLFVLWLSTLIGGVGIGLFIGILVGGRRRNQLIKDAITGLNDLTRKQASESKASMSKQNTPEK
jgi:hypothetical protein